MFFVGDNLTWLACFSEVTELLFQSPTLLLFLFNCFLSRSHFASPVSISSLSSLKTFSLAVSALPPSKSKGGFPLFCQPDDRSIIGRLLAVIWAALIPSREWTIQDTGSLKAIVEFRWRRFRWRNTPTENVGIVRYHWKQLIWPRRCKTAQLRFGVYRCWSNYPGCQAEDCRNTLRKMTLSKRTHGGWGCVR